MTSIALVSQNVENEKRLNHLAVQGIADDIALVTHDEKTLRDMISIVEPIMSEVDLEVKGLKCAVFYDRRSGDNWYKGKNDKKPKVNIQSQLMDVLTRTKPYKTFIKHISLDREDPDQIQELLDKVCNLNFRCN